MVGIVVKDTTCCLPWNHLATHPNGNVTLCCQTEMANGIGFSKDKSNNLLNMDTTSVPDILNSIVDYHLHIQIALIVLNPYLSKDLCDTP